MKLFISYSRDDKHWVYELWRELQQEGHNPWIDRDIPPTADWWGTICENIKDCDVFLYVMTPKSVSSIYCMGEMQYAVALNKPILPLMLKPADFPTALNDRRIQYQEIADLNLDRVLFKIERGLSEARIRRERGEYKPNDIPMPDVPKPQKNPEHIFEVFALAEEEAAAGNIVLAEQFFGQVIATDPDGLGAAAKERLTEIMQDRDRAAAYENVKRLAANPITLKGARAAWRVFQQTYPNYDPDGINAQLTPKQAPPPEQTKAEAPPPRQQSTPQVQPKLPPVTDILPGPFEWCEVPGGEFIYGNEEEGNGPTTLNLPTFYMAKYPITYKQFQVFVDDREGFKDSRWWEGLAADEYDRQLREQNNKQDDHPCERVNWYASIAFCRWLSWKLGGSYAIGEVDKWTVRLPTEFEWEKAARGTDGLIYPYGNEFDKNKANTDESGIGATTPVTRYPQGASPYGVMDMSGNVWDWCLTDYENPQVNVSGENISSETRRVLRGGSWFDYHNFARAASRGYYDPDFRSFNFGFRLCCVRAPQLPEV